MHLKYNLFLNYFFGNGNYSIVSFFIHIPQYIWEISQNKLKIALWFSASLLKIKAFMCRIKRNFFLYKHFPSVACIQSLDNQQLQKRTVTIKWEFALTENHAIYCMSYSDGESCLETYW